MLGRALLFAVFSCFLFQLASGFWESNWTSSELSIGDPDLDFIWDHANVDPDCEEFSDGTFTVASVGDDTHASAWESSATTLCLLVNVFVSGWNGESTDPQPRIITCVLLDLNAPAQPLSNVDSTKQCCQYRLQWFPGAPLCVVHVSGADDVTGRVPGSIDGTYKAFACHDGFPIFYRIDSPRDDERVLWFSERFRDWNINKGLVANPAEVLAFGGDGDAEPRPQLVLSNKWWFVRSAETRTVQDMFMKGEEFRIDCAETDFDAEL